MHEMDGTTGRRAGSRGDAGESEDIDMRLVEGETAGLPYAGFQMCFEAGHYGRHPATNYREEHAPFSGRTALCFSEEFSTTLGIRFRCL